MLRMWNVGMMRMWDVECSGCGMFGCGMFGVWDVRNVECLECGMFGMWSVWNVGCSRCGMFGMWGVRCGMFAGMKDVDLQNALKY